MPTKASASALSPTSASRGKSRVSRKFFAIDQRAPSKGYGQGIDSVSRAGFFSGKVARFNYAAEGVRLLMSLAQSTTVQDAPQWLGREAKSALSQMDGDQSLMAATGFGMGVGASVDVRRWRKGWSGGTLFRWDCTHARCSQANPVRWATDVPHVTESSEMHRVAA
jgi:hypothetical protein